MFTNIQIVLIGASNSGKSSLVKKFAYNEFDKTTMPNADVVYNMTRVDDVKAMLWDTPGNKALARQIPPYIESANGIILVVNAESYDKDKDKDIVEYLAFLKEHCKNNCPPLTIVFNKMDALHENMNLFQRMKIELVLKITATNYGFKQCTIRFCSAENGEKVNKVFQSLIKTIKSNMNPHRLNLDDIKDLINKLEKESTPLLNFIYNHPVACGTILGAIAFLSVIIINAITAGTASGLFSIGVALAAQFGLGSVSATSTTAVGLTTGVGFFSMFSGAAMVSTGTYLTNNSSTQPAG